MCLGQLRRPKTRDPIAAQARVDTARALCEVLLGADYSSLRDIGLEVTVRHYPRIVVEALERGEVKEKEDAIRELARNAIKEALPILRRIAREAQDTQLASISRLAIVRIEGKEIPDGFDKSTPQKFARSFVALVKEHPDRYAEEELEFWGNPLLDSFVKLWKEHAMSGLGPKENSEVAERLEMAKVLEKALKLGDKAFLIHGDQCGVSVEEQKVIRLYKDMFGQWRLTQMP